MKMKKKLRSKTKLALYNALATVVSRRPHRLPYIMRTICIMYRAHAIRPNSFVITILRFRCWFGFWQARDSQNNINLNITGQINQMLVLCEYYVAFKQNFLRKNLVQNWIKREREKCNCSDFQTTISIVS